MHDVTERNRAEAALRESEERFRTLADNIAQLAWMADPAGQIFWYNRRWFEYTGSTLEEMRGWGWTAVHHPEHVDRVVARIQRAWDTGEPWEDTFPLRGKDGQYRWFLSRALPIHDEHGAIVRWFGTNTDITDRLQAEEALRASVEARARARAAAEAERGRLATVLDQLPLGVLIAESPSGRIVQGNRRVVEILRHPVLPSATIAEYGDWVGFHPDGSRIRPEGWPLARAVTQGEVVSGEEVEYLRGDGTRTWIAVSAAPIHDRDGRIVAGVMVFADVGDRKRAEQRQSAQYRIARALAAAAELAEAAPQVLQAICECLDWEWGALWSVDDWAGGLRCAELWHSPSVDLREFATLSRDTTLAPGVGLPGRVWASEQAAWIPDVLADPNFPRLAVADRAGLHGAVAFPVTAAGRTVGVMEFLSREIRQPDDDLLAMMASVGSQIAQFVERTRAEQGLRRSEARKGAILATALDCVVTMDHEGRIVEFNPAAARTFGYAREEVLGQSMAELIIPPTLRAWHQQGLERYLATGEGRLLNSRVETAAMRSDGAEFPAELTITRVPVDGPPLFTGFIRDITERKEAEEARERARAEAECQRDETERAHASLQTFLGIVAHDLRNPLAAMLGNVQLLRRVRQPAEPERQARALEAIERQGRSMNEMIGYLVDAARIGAGQLQVRPEQTDLVLLAQRATEAARAVSERHHVVLEAPERLEGEWDPSRLAQVLDNLLANAVKYSPDGGEVRVRVGHQDGQAVVSVADHGIGMRPEDLPRLFEQFSRLDPGRKIEGTGLGLYITRGIVEAHGGQVRAESSGPGTGSTFTVVLPLKS